jgi:DNA-binding MarR family transcriptional regulator
MTGKKENRPTARSLHQLIKRAGQYAGHAYMGSVGKSGLTQRQLTVLTEVDRSDGTSQIALVKTTGIDRSTLADMVARMMAQGYLQRRRAKNDGRTNSVRITPAGKKMLKSAMPGADEADKSLLAKLAANLRKPFAEALTALAEEMDRIEAESGEKPKPRIKSRKRA